MIRRKTITIKSFFYGAGSLKQYKWQKDGYHIWGVGIDVDILNNFDSLDIIVDKNKYRVSTERAREFVKKYNSFYQVRNYNKILGVISLSILRNITTQKQNVNNQTTQTQ